MDLCPENLEFVFLFIVGLSVFTVSYSVFFSISDIGSVILYLYLFPYSLLLLI